MSLLTQGATGNLWGLKPMDYFGGDMAGMAVNGQWWGVRPDTLDLGKQMGPDLMPGKIKDDWEKQMGPDLMPGKIKDAPNAAEKQKLEDEKTKADWGSVSLGLSIGSALAKAYGAYAEARMVAGNLATQSDISATNAKLMQLGVDQTFRRRDAEVAMFTRKAAEVKARARVAYASRGVAVGTGTTAEVLASSDIHKTVDKMTADANAVAAAWGYRRKAIQYSAQAKAQQIMSDAYRKSAPWRAGISLLSSAAQMIGSYNRFSVKVGG